MIIIAHRGLMYGPDPSGFYQNKPGQVKAALDAGFDVEVDIWITLGFATHADEENWNYNCSVRGMILGKGQAPIKPVNYNEKFWLGHDRPDYRIEKEFLLEFKDRLWLHCKDVDTVSRLKNLDEGFNYFYHTNDDMTLTSKGFIWTFPGKECPKNGIKLLPENNRNWHFSELKTRCLGICTDYPVEFSKYV